MADEPKRAESKRIKHRATADAIKALVQERRRLVAANEHWHIRVEQEKTLRGQAESALAECIAHADQLEAEIFELSAYDSNDAVIAYRAWRAKQ